MTAFRSIILLSLFCAGSAAPASQNLIRNGGFEDEVDLVRGTEWSAWGGAVVSQYTRDRERPHGGAWSMKLERMPNQEGYLVPALANCPALNAGFSYELRFWARSEKPGTSRLLVSSFETITPLKSGPRIGVFAFETTREWKEYSFTFESGVHFSADRSKYIMPAFFPVAKYPLATDAEERTLWVDDVSLVGSAAASASGNDTPLAVTLPELRLKPGNEMRISVSPAKVIGRANPLVGGISFATICGPAAVFNYPYDKFSGAYTLGSSMESAIRDLRLPLTRVYSLGVEPRGMTPWPVETSLDKLAHLLSQTGIPQETSVICLEDVGADSVLGVDQYVKALRYCKEKGYRFRYWEVGNEIYDGKAYPTPELYAEKVKAVHHALKAIDPGAQIGLCIAKDRLAMEAHLIKIAAGSYDFVAPHWYGHVISDDFSETVLGNNHEIINRIAYINALIKRYNPGKEVVQYDTEWGLAGNREGISPFHDDRNANILGSIYRAVRLIYYARENLMGGASAWCLVAKTNARAFAVLSREVEDQRFMLYWVHYYFNRIIGDTILAMDGTVPYITLTRTKCEPYLKLADLQNMSVPLVPMLVSSGEGGKWISVMAANGSWTRTVPCEINLTQCKAVSAQAVYLSSDDIDASPLLAKKEDFVHTLAVRIDGPRVSFSVPPHAAVFIKLITE